MAAKISALKENHQKPAKKPLIHTADVPDADRRPLTIHSREYLSET